MGNVEPVLRHVALTILAALAAGWAARGDVEAWMRANDNRAGRNACAIRRAESGRLEYTYFRRSVHSIGGMKLFNTYKQEKTILEKNQ